MTTKSSEFTNFKKYSVCQASIPIRVIDTFRRCAQTLQRWCCEMKLWISTKLMTVSILFVGSFVTSGFASTSDAPTTINVSVKKFAYEPSQITLKKGEPVVIKLTTQDVAHGLKFKELNLNTRIEKGKPAELAFTPTQTGDFVGHCSVFCGSGHGSMTLTLHVTE
jgi:cytochrome c oxidase subunit II